SSRAGRARRWTAARTGTPSSRRGWRTTTPPPSSPTAGTAGCRSRCRTDAPQWTVRRRVRRPPRRSLARVDTVEEWRGEDYQVRRITGSTSTKPYRCPGCDQVIRPVTPHVVAWPAADPEAGERRHWHT